ncbi:MAG: ornithine carbamoyltransferase [Actinomycetota bacterium]
MTTHFLSMRSITAEQMHALLDRAAQMKSDRKLSDVLRGRSVAMIFEKPSTRTRVSFQVGVHELGGHALSLSSSELQLGRGETIEDTARVLSRFVHGVVVRTFEQSRVERLAAASSVPVINALTDLEHPCQALADMQTIQERFGKLEGRKLAYIGDGNNVAHSLLLAGAMGGMSVSIASPPGYEPMDEFVSDASTIASGHGQTIVITPKPSEAVVGADVVYTDVWTSMGQEAETKARIKAFEGFIVDAALMSQAKPEAIAMHDLPAHRGEEITDEVIDGPQSAVWDQAENRLHAQKALMEWLLK